MKRKELDFMTGLHSRQNCVLYPGSSSGACNVTDLLRDKVQCYNYAVGIRYEPMLAPEKGAVWSINHKEQRTKRVGSVCVSDIMC